MDLFVLFQKLIPQKLVTLAAGILASVKYPPVKNFLINQFIKIYKVDMTEALALSIDQYRDFNDFFTRELRKGSRPVSESRYSIISPADGTISELGSIQSGRLLQAKGKNFLISELLASQILASELEDGAFATVYLSPRDYHRVHMPMAAMPASLTYVPGKLFSVNDRTARNLDNLFALNERLVAHFKHQETGLSFVIVLVGALIVGGMETVLTGKIERSNNVQNLDFSPKVLAKGEEFARFYLGSTAIVICPAELGARLSAELHPGSQVRMGQELAVRK